MLEPPCRGGSYEYRQCMFWVKNKKNRYNPYTPDLPYIKLGYKGRIHYTDMLSRWVTKVVFAQLAGIWVYD